MNWFSSLVFTKRYNVTLRALIIETKMYYTFVDVCGTYWWVREVSKECSKAWVMLFLQTGTLTSPKFAVHSILMHLFAVWPEWQASFSPPLRGKKRLSSFFIMCNMKNRENSDKTEMLSLTLLSGLNVQGNNWEVSMHPNSPVEYENSCDKDGRHSVC